MKSKRLLALSTILLVALMAGAFALTLNTAQSWGPPTLYVSWNPSSYTVGNPVPEPWTASLSYSASGTTWKKPTAVYSKCGQDTSHPATYAIDGSTYTYWSHSTTEYHWIVVDMGATTKISQIRIYQSSTSSYRWGRTYGLTVYVSDDPNNWGTAPWTGRLDYSYGWQTSGTFSAQGRYVKLVSKSSSSSQRLYELQVGTPIGIDPSTVLLEGLYSPESPPYYGGWWGKMLICPFNGNDVLTALYTKGGHMSPGQSYVISLTITAKLYDGTTVTGSASITLTIPSAPPP
jgi:hypothetical protein